jgi:hypothetical protein
LFFSNFCRIELLSNRGLALSPDIHHGSDTSQLPNANAAEDRLQILAIFGNPGNLGKFPPDETLLAQKIRHALGERCHSD